MKFSFRKPTLETAGVEEKSLEEGGRRHRYCRWTWDAPTFWNLSFQKQGKSISSRWACLKPGFLWRLKSTPVLYHLRQKDIFAYVCYVLHISNLEATIMEEMQATTCIRSHPLP